MDTANRSVSEKAVVLEDKVTDDSDNVLCCVCCRYCCFCRDFSGVVGDVAAAADGTEAVDRLPYTRRLRGSVVVHGRPISLQALQVSMVLPRWHLQRFFLHQSQLISARCLFSGGTRRRIKRSKAADGGSMGRWEAGATVMESATGMLCRSPGAELIAEYDGYLEACMTGTSTDVRSRIIESLEYPVRGGEKQNPSQQAGTGSGR